jgi:glutathione S-transferase
MTIKIYGMWASTATSTVLVTLLEKDIEFDLIFVDLTLGDHKQPDHLALQPFGQIPVLQDGDFTMFESRAIMRYICEQYPNLGPPSLYGSNLFEKARVEQWLEVEHQQLLPILVAIYYQFMAPVITGKKVDHQILAEETEKLAKVLDVYEAHLADNKYLAGDFVSIADLAHLPLCYGVFTLCKHREVLQTHKRFAAWFNEISHRPAWLKVVENAAPVFDDWQKRMELDA